MPELKRMPATRIVASPAVLDATPWPKDSLALRFAPDEALVSPPVADVTDLMAKDPHAIVIADAGYAGVWLAADEALDFLERACDWEIPAARPAFAQGAVAGIPAKLWLETGRILLMVPAPYAVEFEERMA